MCHGCNLLEDGAKPSEIVGTLLTSSACHRLCNRVRFAMQTMETQVESLQIELSVAVSEIALQSVKNDSSVFHGRVDHTLTASTEMDISDDENDISHPEYPDHGYHLSSTQKLAVEAMDENIYSAWYIQRMIQDREEMHPVSIFRLDYHRDFIANHERTHGSPSHAVQTIPEHDLVQMIQFHEDCIKPLAERIHARLATDLAESQRQKTGMLAGGQRLPQIFEGGVVSDGVHWDTVTQLYRNCIDYTRRNA